MNCDSPAACRIFDAEDVMRWALAAYYGASRAIEPPEGEPWLIEGCPYSSAASFVNEVHSRFTQALNSAALAARIPCDHGCANTPLGWDDSGFPESLFSGPKLNGLPAPENRADNQAERGFQGA
ncbi:MAG TPA: hypothetical protein VFG55_01110 [Rhodanobacteraceae bacterium]|nr:hypothetical protein [Rhodanobacteraceae bacterium]